MPEHPETILRSQLLERRRKLEVARETLPEPDQVIRLLAEVDAALSRMDEGVYGLCEECHDSIEADRLMADPLVCFCLDHLDSRERRALQADLDLALRIQSTLLPGKRLCLAGWDAAHYYEPAGPVSGDYCDLIPPPGERGELFFAVGDVSGKGISAALLMSNLQAIFRSLLAMDLPLAELVRRANRVFCENTLPMHYATLVCGRADGLGTVELCNAGHCPPVLVRHGGTVEVAATGLPLGLFREGTFAISRLELGAADSLVLYTDGVTEAKDGSGHEYGAERLTSVLRARHGQACDTLQRAVYEDLLLFLNGAPRADDLTLMVLQRTAGGKQ